MIITSDDIRKRIANLWPDIDMVLLTDRLYLIPKLRDYVDIIKKHSVKDLQFVPNIRECEEFSAKIVSDIRNGRAEKVLSNEINKDEMFNYCIGIAMGWKFKYYNNPHTLVIFLTTDEVYFLDPQTDRFWEADPNNDDVFFIGM